MEPDPRAHPRCSSSSDRDWIDRGRTDFRGMEEPSGKLTSVNEVPERCATYIGDNLYLTGQICAGSPEDKHMKKADIVVLGAGL
ncbi:hypothetical protein, partial [Hoeflea sp.]|uniref:hypothetical protein n=1 Tax=Hoeflea sp. TaxID=1940281 RepID=UPI002AFE8C41